jgi:hypothetical protein
MININLFLYVDCLINNLIYIENVTTKSTRPSALPILVGCGLIENFTKCDISTLSDYVTFLLCPNKYKFDKF